jgi:hypothetical protein
MSRKWISGLVGLVAVAGTALAATSAFSTDTQSRPEYTPVTVDLSDARAKGGVSGTKKKPKVVYLRSAAPTTINPAEPAVGTTGVGAYIDVKLSGCSKVIDGGVAPRSTDVYVQGSYIKSPSEFHVLIGLDDAAAAASPRATFLIDTHLTCLKGVK